MQDYCLVCMHCGEQLSLGKAMEVHDPRLQRDINCFELITDKHDDHHQSWPENELNELRKHWRYTDHFLMRHRGHEIRILPEKLLREFESDAFPHYPAAERAILDGANEENYYLTPTGIPHQAKEAAILKESVEWRLNELTQGINMTKPAWDEEK